MRNRQRFPRSIVPVATTLAAALVLAACTSSSSGNGSATDASSKPTSASPTPTDSNAAAANAAPVHVSLLEGDGGVYGVGMPIIAYFTKRVTDANAFESAVKVSVNGQPASGAWYWEKSGHRGTPVEAHYRLKDYWPANAKIQVDLPLKGLSAGVGLAYDDNLTLSISTGDAHVSTVDCSAERMTVTSNGKQVRTMPTSCGKATTPTYTGTKVVMQKGENLPGSSKLRPDGAVEMRGTDPSDRYDLIVPWSVRLTASGEYAHAASWNGGNIGVRSTSNGCTNLNESDAKWFYAFSQIGDVLTYANTGGKRMPSWDGYGDWNLTWSAWTTGGLL